MHDHVRLHDERNLTVADSLMQRPVAEETKEEILELFKTGHSASSAYHIFMLDQMVKFGDEFELRSLDRSKFPCEKFFHNFYQKNFTAEFGAKTGERAFEKVSEFANEYNGKTTDGKIMVERDGTEFLVAGCTPIMKRAHELLVESGDIVLVDSTGNFECSESRVFFMICPTAAGGFPLGFGISHSESAETLEKLFELMKRCLPANAFYGRGPDVGPRIFMIDGSLSERKALSRTFSAITVEFKF